MASQTCGGHATNGRLRMSGMGAGSLLNFKEVDSGFLKLGTGAVTMDMEAQIEFDQTKRCYLDLIPGTPGPHDTNAGGKRSGWNGA